MSEFPKGKKPSRIRLLFHWHVLKFACLSPVWKKYSWYIMLLISVVVNVFAENMILSDKLKYFPYIPHLPFKILFPPLLSINIISWLHGGAARLIPLQTPCHENPRVLGVSQLNMSEGTACVEPGAEATPGKSWDYRTSPPFEENIGLYEMDILNFLTLKSGQALLPGWK